MLLYVFTSSLTIGSTFASSFVHGHARVWLCHFSLYLSMAIFITKLPHLWGLHEARAKSAPLTRKVTSLPSISFLRGAGNWSNWHCYQAAAIQTFLKVAYLLCARFRKSHLLIILTSKWHLSWNEEFLLSVLHFLTVDNQETLESL